MTAEQAKEEIHALKQALSRAERDLDREKSRADDLQKRLFTIVEGTGVRLKEDPEILELRVRVDLSAFRAYHFREVCDEAAHQLAAALDRELHMRAKG